MEEGLAFIQIITSSSLFYCSSFHTISNDLFWIPITLIQVLQIWIIFKNINRNSIKYN